MRVRRFAFNLLAGASLVVMLALAIVWASQVLPLGFRVRFDWTLIDSHDRVIELEPSSNMLMLVDSRIYPRSLSTAQANAILANQRKSPFHITWIGLKWTDEPSFEWHPTGVTLYGTARVYLVPFGLLVFVFAILPAGRWLPSLVRWTRRHFTVPAGHCRKCGYDLRASPDVCPECGTPCNPQPLTT